MNVFKLAIAYLEWRWKAYNRHGIHSPFLYRFLDQCLYAPMVQRPMIENRRKALLQDTSLLQYPDLGAGQRNWLGRINAGEKNLSVAQLARTSLQPAEWANRLMRMAGYFKTQRILELGTSLGITTAYLASANPDIEVDTVEGIPVIAHKASETFQQLGLDNIRLYEGDFDYWLPLLLEQNQYDMVYLDGNHSYDAVMKYFRMLCKHMPGQGVLIIDDIRWSSGMWQAWKQISDCKAVTLSIDLFYMGIVFFHPNLSKQSFKIRY